MGEDLKKVCSVKRLRRAKDTLKKSREILYAVTIKKALFILSARSLMGLDRVPNFTRRNDALIVGGKNTPLSCLINDLRIK